MERGCSRRDSHKLSSMVTIANAALPQLLHRIKVYLEKQVLVLTETVHAFFPDEVDLVFAAVHALVRKTTRLSTRARTRFQFSALDDQRCPMQTLKRPAWPLQEQAKPLSALPCFSERRSSTVGTYSIRRRALNQLTAFPP